MSQSDTRIQSSPTAPIAAKGSQPQFIYVYPADAPLPSLPATRPARTRPDRPVSEWLKLAAKREVMAIAAVLACGLFTWSWGSREITRIQQQSFYRGYNTAIADAHAQIAQAQAAQAAAEAKTAAAQSTIAQVQALVAGQPAPAPTPPAAPAPAASVPVPSPAPAQ